MTELTAPKRFPARDEIVDVLVPMSFNFPHGAKVLSIGFVLFAGWYAGVEIPAARYPALGGAGLLAVFGSINTATPFLLDLVRVPADLFQLFVVSGVLNSRFGAMTSIPKKRRSGSSRSTLYCVSTAPSGRTSFSNA